MVVRFTSPFNYDKAMQATTGNQSIGVAEKCVRLMCLGALHSRCSNCINAPTSDFTVPFARSPQTRQQKKASKDFKFPRNRVETVDQMLFKWRADNHAPSNQSIRQRSVPHDFPQDTLWKEKRSGAATAQEICTTIYSYTTEKIEGSKRSPMSKAPS